MEVYLSPTRSSLFILLTCQMEHVALTCEKLNEKKIDPKVVLIQLQEIP